MDYAITTTLDLPFTEATDRVRAALAEQGFGILTEIDVRATMKAKLDEEMADHLILGACNPPLAHRALQADPRIGLLLPCNVVVRTADGRTVVEAMDPQLLVAVTEQPGLQSVAEEAAGRLRAALDSLTA